MENFSLLPSGILVLHEVSGVSFIVPQGEPLPSYVQETIDKINNIRSQNNNEEN